MFSFFAPVFFLRAGTQIEVRGIDRPTLGMSAVLLATAAGLKYVGTAGAMRWVVPAGAHFGGALFDYRLTFGIITATVGMREGLLDSRRFTTILPVVLASAALPMLLLRDIPSEFSR